MRRVWMYIFLLCAIGSMNAQEVLILPFDADSLTSEQKAQKPVYIAYPAALKDEVPAMRCEPKEPVDLGLPSGLKWATCNIGAESPEDYGYYFAWGEVEPDSSYNWPDYKWCKGKQKTFTKYCTCRDEGTVDNKTVLEDADDAAVVNWGGSWRMPTEEEMRELVDNCTWTWTSQNGVAGSLATGPNGNSIFFPVGGYKLFDRLEGAESGFYYSKSLEIFSYCSSSGASNLQVMSSRTGVGGCTRMNGTAIRPVCP